MSATDTARPVTSDAPGEGRRPAVLTIDHLDVDYETEHPVHAVKDVSLSLAPGEILGLAGESGCGKTTLAYGIIRLLRPPAKVTSGSITFHDRDGTDVDLLGLPARAAPGGAVDEAVDGVPGGDERAQPGHHDPRPARRRPGRTPARACRARNGGQSPRTPCARVGVDPARITAYPHELSGGMRQRVMIAMAMPLEPQIMIMDEPTTALDVVVQREILREIIRLRDELGFAVVFITHDLPLLLEISDRIAIMLRGEVVECDACQRDPHDPQHPYTQKLLAVVPEPDRSPRRVHPHRGRGRRRTRDRHPGRRGPGSTGDGAMTTVTVSHLGKDFHTRRA